MDRSLGMVVMVSSDDGHHLGPAVLPSQVDVVHGIIPPSKLRPTELRNPSLHSLRGMVSMKTDKEDEEEEEEEWRRRRRKWIQKQKQQNSR